MTSPISEDVGKPTPQLRNLSRFACLPRGVLIERIEQLSLDRERIRNEAFEEAAKVAEQGTSIHLAVPYIEGENLAGTIRRSIAEAVRRLKGDG